jgi:DNA topoisomerase IB
MPRLRARVAELLAADGLGRPRVLGLALRLLDIGLFRVGNERSALVDHHFGLTTLRRGQVRVRDGAATFDYVAKSGKRRVLELRDAEAVDVLGALKRRRGGPEELLAYRRARAWSHVHSNEVNDALRAAAGGPFSAKEFRTWNATVLAAVALAARPGGGARAVSAAMREVSGALGNTPAVARASYVDPRVLRAFEAGRTVSVAHLHALDDWPRRARVEGELLDLLPRVGA